MEWCLVPSSIAKIPTGRCRDSAGIIAKIPRGWCRDSAGIIPKILLGYHQYQSKNSTGSCWIPLGSYRKSSLGSCTETSVWTTLNIESNSSLSKRRIIGLTPSVKFSEFLWVAIIIQPSTFPLRSITLLIYFFFRGQTRRTFQVTFSNKQLTSSLIALLFLFILNLQKPC